MRIKNKTDLTCHGNTEGRKIVTELLDTGLDALDPYLRVKQLISVEHGKIVLHTEGRSMGNYCYTADAVRGLLTVLLRGKTGEAYTVVNESTSMPIREVARLVSDTLTGGATRIIFDIPESSLTYGYAPDVTMRLSGAKLRALGWEPEVGLAQMFERLAGSFCHQRGGSL